jgi:hypothetical protein
MTEFHYFFLIALGLVMIGWGTRCYADDDVTIYPAPASGAGAASSTAHVASTADGSPVIHKSFHKHRKSKSSLVGGEPGMQPSDSFAGSTGQKTSKKKKASADASISPTVITTTNAPVTLPTAPATVTVAAHGDRGPQITISSPVPTPPPLPANSPPRPQVETGLPIARPGFEKSTVVVGSTIISGNGSHHGNYESSFLPPLGSLGNETGGDRAKSVLDNFNFTNFDKRIRNYYPWKTNIITTEFWIGEGSTPISSTTNVASAWDEDWTYHDGGSDLPGSRDGYASKYHAATVNPFYVALPFNDLAFPDKARRWLPAGWYRPPRDGKQVSACKDRWVEIKNSQGDICYAQWEDVGPLRYDHAEYVFGDERPDTYTRAGLDVSPAVAKYLHIDERNRYTRWRFVDDADVPPGEWLRYDEQAVLFNAMHSLNAKNDPASLQPIQDTTAPVDDSSEIDSNKKKIGAAKG